jgi:hypothetical protein
LLGQLGAEEFARSCARDSAAISALWQQEHRPDFAGMLFWQQSFANFLPQKILCWPLAQTHPSRGIPPTSVRATIAQTIARERSFRNVFIATPESYSNDFQRVFAAASISLEFNIGNIVPTNYSALFAPVCFPGILTLYAAGG